MKNTCDTGLVPSTSGLVLMALTSSCTKSPVRPFTYTSPPASHTVRYTHVGGGSSPSPPSSSLYEDEEEDEDEENDEEDEKEENKEEDEDEEEEEEVEEEEEEEEEKVQGIQRQLFNMALTLLGYNEI